MKRFTALLLTALMVSPALAGDEFKADFKNELGEGWTFVREDSADWRFKDRALELLAQPSNIWEKANLNTENFLLRPIPRGPFAVEVTVDFKPTRVYEQAGLMIYVDDDNYLKFDRENIEGNQNCTLVWEINAKVGGGKTIPFREGPLRLRLEVSSEGQVTAKVKSPGEDSWTMNGSTTLPGPPDKVQVGLFALNGDPEAPRWAWFKDFSISTNEKQD